MCSEALDHLLSRLKQSDEEFARSYLTWRDRGLDVKSSYSNAVLDLGKRDIELPEALRLRIHSALGIQRAVEPS
jgi:hypothetical protein